MAMNQDRLLYWAIEYRKDRKYPEELARDQKLKRSVRRRANSLVVDDNTGRVYDNRRNKRVEVVLRTEEKERILIQYHSSGHGHCHLGWKKTWNAIASRFYWKGLSNDVKKWVANCDVCQQRVNRQTQCTGKWTQLTSIPNWFTTTVFLKKLTTVFCQLGLSSSDPGFPQQVSDRLAVTES